MWADSFLMHFLIIICSKEQLQTIELVRVRPAIYAIRNNADALKKQKRENTYIQVAAAMGGSSAVVAKNRWNSRRRRYTVARTGRADKHRTPEILERLSFLEPHLRTGVTNKCYISAKNGKHQYCLLAVNIK